MPGKVNPVISEAALMVCARVIGNDVSLSLAGQAGNFQLNTMLPLIAHCLLESASLLTRICYLLAEKAIRSFVVNADELRARVECNPILATVLTRRLGYDRSAEIVKRAMEEGRSIRNVAAEMTDLSQDELQELLDPERILQE
jgi:fumarate hydratase class II